MLSRMWSPVLALGIAVLPAVGQAPQDTRPGIAVLPFYNGGSYGQDRENFDALQRGIAGMLISELAANPAARLVEREQVAEKAHGFTSERLPTAVETGLYRVAQEAMTNVARHARATRVDVLLERLGDRVVLVVEDDGAGFETGRILAGEHFGLLGMRERAESLGGNLTVESTPGSGTTIVVEVPHAGPHPDR